MVCLSHSEMSAASLRQQHGIASAGMVGAVGERRLSLYAQRVELRNDAGMDTVTAHSLHLHGGFLPVSPPYYSSALYTMSQTSS